MCGIFGGINLDKNSRTNILLNMNHRGPDGSGFFIDNLRNVMILHSRLSIIDISSAASQPMIDNSNNFVISFNGEIYNYLEIKKNLQTKGYIFKTKSDTEVLLYSFIEWKEKCLDYLRGMFAFCIYEKKTGKFFLARDRFGIKPLIYYSNKAGQFYFTSEIKFIIKEKNYKKKFNYQILNDYFQFGSISQPNTILDDHYFLPAGHYLIFEPGYIPKIYKYYDLKNKIANTSNNIKKKQILEGFKEIFDETIKYHSLADTEISTFLSGGIDSSAASAMMQKNSNKQIKSFNLLFSSFKNIHDESKSSYDVSKFIGSKHYNFEITNSDISNIFDDFISDLDQPSIDGINTYLISKRASMEVKVAISGLGADEIFGGYPFYKDIIKYSNSQKFFYDNFLSSINQIKPNRFTQKFQIKKNSPEKNIYDFRSICKPEKILKNKDLVKNLFENDGLSILNRISIYEIENYLVNTLLRDTDINSMSSSLEVRPVFLDHKLVEFVLNANDKYTINSDINKKLLIDSVKNLIPNSVILAKRKLGFEFPYIEWMNENLNEKFNEILLNKNNKLFLSQIVKEKYLLKLINRAYKKKLNYTDWPIFILIHWFDKNNKFLNY